jgi:hypothetical protein
MDKLARLAGQPTDLATFWRSSTEVISTVVPHFWAPCFFTLDPASLLVTSSLPRHWRTSTTATT